jgi:hypothetical protein
LQNSISAEILKNIFFIVQHVDFHTNITDKNLLNNIGLFTRNTNFMSPGRRAI